MNFAIECPEETTTLKSFDVRCLPKTPVVLRGGIKEWPACDMWSPEYLSAAFGDTKVCVEVYTKEQTPSSIRLMTFMEFMSDANSDSLDRLFMAEVDLRRNMPSVCSDVVFPSGTAGKQVKALLFCGKDSLTPLHYHETEDAVLCQIIGEKRLVLCAPRCGSALKPNPWYALRRNYSNADARHWLSQTESSAALANIRVLTCILQPGDAIFIPLHWWHTVGGNSFSASVTLFWRSERRWENPLLSIRTSIGTAADLLWTGCGYVASQFGLERQAATLAKILRITDNREALERDLASKLL
jgi:hypothetical protein